MNGMKKFVFTMVLVFAAPLWLAAQLPVGPEITYQGTLDDGGQPANGTYSMEFILWDAPAAGNLIGSMAFGSVDVNNGRFTVELDFGPNAFDGDERWLELEVEDVILSPRQKITAAPYATFSSNTRGLFVDSANDVGIGTTNPQTSLEVAGAIRSAGASGGSVQLFNPDNQNASFNLSWLNDVARLRIGGSGAGANGGFDIQRIGDESMLRIDGDRNVGIGTQFPEHRLHVQQGSAGNVTASSNSSGVFERSSTNYISILSPGNTQRGVLFGDPESSGNGAIIFNNAFLPDGLQFRTGGGVTQMSIDTFGYVGVGTDMPDGRLHVMHDSSDNAILGENSGSAAGVFGHNTQTTGIRSGVFGRSDSSGGRGVMGWGTSPTGNNSGVQGQSDSSSGGRGVYGYASSTNGTNYGVYGQSNSSSGYDFYAAGAGVNYGASSSRRWKHNVVAIGDPLAKLARIRGVYFDWDKQHGGAHDIGMIAEEVGQVLPEVVQFEENGIDASGMDYSKLTPLLVEAVKELRSEKNRQLKTIQKEHETVIAALQDENVQLRDRLEALEAAVANLTSN